ncbi:ABC transporter ATP-binding protein [Carnobacterium maltaromaticum]|uniref:ABC transporter ATP-binding protein n=1 Tax=Carnobacterium maltaromaticum TaxID=2751 RepID=UPI00295EF317|nr:ABC transporter ATP-binding protein [Carnobacterium maltaromaticum]
MQEAEKILEIKGLYKSFKSNKEEVTILRNINLVVNEKESVAVIGESGCGKTTLGKVIVDIFQPTQGTVKYRGKDISKMTKKEYQAYRLKVQMVQQDSFAALNPYKTIFHSVSTAMIQHKIVKGEKAARIKVTELLEDVGLTPVEHFIDKYPHQLSGGQRQRILIARALSVNPELIIADEPVSMVDVSLRIALLQLLRKMNEKYGVSFVYITHDLATARYISDTGKLVVMYLGEIVEQSAITTAVKNPLHPYFKALVQAVPQATPGGNFKGAELQLKGIDVPDVKNVPSGCPFHPRCIYATAECEKIKPQLEKVGDSQVACLYTREIQQKLVAK